jgi:micrococcal nuclease
MNQGAMRHAVNTTCARTLILAVAIGVVAILVGAERSAPMLVRFVVDGDTIDVAGIGRVRLLGIDAPEIGSGFDTPAPFAIDAKNRLADLVANRWVRLEYEGAARDTYNRRLAYVLLDSSTCVNVILVREGLARVSARVSLSRLGELKSAEATARAFRRGIWSAGTLQPAERSVVPRTKPQRKKRPASGPVKARDGQL